MKNVSTSPFIEINVLDPGEPIDIRHLKLDWCELKPIACYVKPDGAIHTAPDGHKHDAPSLAFVLTDEQGHYVLMQISAPMIFPALNAVLRMLKKDDLWKDLGLFRKGF